MNEDIFLRGVLTLLLIIAANTSHFNLSAIIFGLASICSAVAFFAAVAKWAREG